MCDASFCFHLDGHHRLGLFLDNELERSSKEVGGRFGDRWMMRLVFIIWRMRRDRCGSIGGGQAAVQETVPIFLVLVVAFGHHTTQTP